ncbi:MAG: glucose-1-phosphate cytidylyltransferase, partial [Nitrospinaceae bacterium]|nr:glucose-1-phosphate cytidylyltransferase [Nitrospinaceae bacterium]
MPVIILCGGMGTRIRDVSDQMPKPMITIGNYPILWHIMRIYGHHGYKNFILALGYKSWVIKEYFLNYQAMTSDFRIQLAMPNEVTLLEREEPLNWNITFAETGEQTQTGKRVALCEPYVQTDEFMVTYGDGVGDIDVSALHQFHRDHGKTATVTGVRPAGRFGALQVDGTAVSEFSEKKDAGGGLINGGFFVFNKSFFDVLRPLGDVMLETTPMDELVARSQLQMYEHHGFWEPMDTLREY